jgi:hypothetical protein
VSETINRRQCLEQVFTAKEKAHVVLKFRTLLHHSTGQARSWFLSLLSRSNNPAQRDLGALSVLTSFLYVSSLHRCVQSSSSWTRFSYDCNFASPRACFIICNELESLPSATLPSPSPWLYTFGILTGQHGGYCNQESPYTLRFPAPPSLWKRFESQG